ncbi:MAG: hypothetical protein EPN30_03140 [Actinomycetota bacterium]|nr:MAG: hypothetical protein EPN30_03140 [Actinomycetota bacterium]
MQISTERIEKVFGTSAELDSGLGIVETGAVAGGISTLFLIGFELLGRASAEVEPDNLVIACAAQSRLMGEMAEEFIKYIPVIPSVEKQAVLSFSGRLDSFSAEGLYQEIGPIGSIDFVRSHLVKFLATAVSHYLSRCSDISDRSFSRVLGIARLELEEILQVLNVSDLEWNRSDLDLPGNLSLIREFFDL